MSDNLNFENKEDMEKTIVMEPISETKNIQEDTSKKFEIEVVDDFDFLHKDNNETEKQNDEVKQPELNQILEYKNDNNE